MPNGYGLHTISQAYVSGLVAALAAKLAVASDAVCRAWIQFDGTGTIAIDDSFNVSSITDIGVGIYKIDWDTAFANANYSGVVSSWSRETAIYNHNAADIRVKTYDSGGNIEDSAHVDVQAFGEPV